MSRERCASPIVYFAATWLCVIGSARADASSHDEYERLIKAATQDFGAGDYA